MPADAPVESPRFGLDELVTVGVGLDEDVGPVELEDSAVVEVAEADTVHPSIAIASMLIIVVTVELNEVGASWDV